MSYVVENSEEIRVCEPGKALPVIFQYCPFLLNCLPRTRSYMWNQFSRSLGLRTGEQRCADSASIPLQAAIWRFLLPETPSRRERANRLVESSCPVSCSFRKL